MENWTYQKSYIKNRLVPKPDCSTWKSKTMDWQVCWTGSYWKQPNRRYRAGKKYTLPSKSGISTGRLEPLFQTKFPNCTSQKDFPTILFILNLQVLLAKVLAHLT